jgi:hypothetical protein
MDTTPKRRALHAAELRVDFSSKFRFGRAAAERESVSRVMYGHEGIEEAGTPMSRTDAKHFAIYY